MNNKNFCKEIIGDLEHSTEEIFKYFSPVILLSMMSAAVSADFVSREVFGMAPIFNFEIMNTIPLNQYWLLIFLGILLGGMGALYNYLLLKTKALYGKVKFFDDFIVGTENETTVSNFENILLNASLK